MNKNIYYVPSFREVKQGKYMLYLFYEIYKKNGELYDNDMNAFPLNVRSVAIHKNDYDPDYFLNIAADIASMDNAVEQMKDIVYEAICEKIINEKDGKILIVSQKDGVVPVSVDIFTNVLLYGTDSEGFRQIITELWHTKFNKKSNL